MAKKLLPERSKIILEKLVHEVLNSEEGPLLMEILETHIEKLNIHQEEKERFLDEKKVLLEKNNVCAIKA